MDIFVNQVGYAAKGRKRAVMNFPCKSFQVRDEAGKVCLEGYTKEFGFDKASGDKVYIADFSSLKTEGVYRICATPEVIDANATGCAAQAGNAGAAGCASQAGNAGAADCASQTVTSPSFEIGAKRQDKLLNDLVRAYYYLRCGMELTEEYAGDYKHAACHLGITKLWDDHRKEIETRGGWHDAGDYGRYITAGACALSHLLYAYRMFPGIFAKRDFHIPESGNGTPDLLNECRYELEWFLKLQREDGGVYHKVTTAQHAPFVMPEEDLAQLYALPVSSMATADFAAVTALASGIYREFDSAFADRLQEAALLSYSWLREHPEFVRFKNPEGCGTGEYGEWNDDSNRFWAAAELYAMTGDSEYHDDMVRMLDRAFPLTALGYGEVGGFGLLAYLMTERKRDARLKERFLDAFVKTAATRVRVSEECGYSVALMEWEYYWGSNMGVMQQGMLFAIIDYFGLEERVKRASADAELPKRRMWPGEKEIPYEQGPREVKDWSMYDFAHAQLDYLMGCNALGVSYVTGNGERAYNDPHLRPAHVDGIDACMPGMVSGGPNRRPMDEKGKELIPEGTPSMKCFADHWLCYSLNEITIYWNSPAVFTLAYLMSKE